MPRDEAYRKAENKIEEARRSGATELDLSNEWNAPDDKKLTALPESIGQPTQLQSLKLSDNQLTALPEWLGYPDTRAHAPNENIRLDLYLKHARHMARLMVEFQ